MAIIDPTVTPWMGSATKVVWANTSSADTINPYNISGMGGAVASWQAVAANAGGATVKMTSSNDGTNYEDVPDLLGNAVALTAGAMTQISLADYWILPDITGGTSDDWTITAILRD